MSIESTTPLPIVTFDGPNCACLLKKTEPIKDNELDFAKKIAGQLISTLSQYSPAAGLAAPQIGISKSVFIYSYDRNPKHLETVINPSFTPIGDERINGWEACFSSLLSQKTFFAANIPRYEKIAVSYLDLDGKKIEQNLDGFAAKVFQHEYDHLEGVGNIHRKDGEIKQFESSEALKEFMKSAHLEDQKHYQKPSLD